MSLEKFQQEFAAALTSTDPKAAPPSFEVEAKQRFRIYRNNYFASLAGRLGEVFPAVKKALGEKPFNDLVYRYASAQPPTARSLAVFGGEFKAFLGKQTIQPPFIPDLAELEYACHETLHAKDAKPLDPKDVAAFGDKVIKTRFNVHPAANLLVFNYPVLEIKRLVLEETKTAQTSKARTAVLITRPAVSVLTTRLERPEELFLRALIEEKTPEQAIEDVERDGLILEVQNAFSVFISAGVFCRLEP